MQNPPPPPSTLTMPTLSVTDDTTLFFSVVETFQGCPVSIFLVLLSSQFTDWLSA